MEKTAVGEAVGMDGSTGVGCGTGVDSGVIVGGNVAGIEVSGGAATWCAPNVAVGSSCCARGLQAASARMSRKMNIGPCFMGILSDFAQCAPISVPGYLFDGHVYCQPIRVAASGISISPTPPEGRWMIEATPCGICQTSSQSPSGLICEGGSQSCE
jgi:hypothetical protein